MIKKLLLSPLKLFAPLRRVGYGLLMAMGVGVAVFFIGFGLLVNVQTLGVLLAGVGAALGTLILSLTVPKWLVGADGSREKQLRQELDKLLTERSAMATELARVKSQQLQLGQVQTVLKLTLLELDVQLTDFKKEALGTKDKTLGGQVAREYVGVLRKQSKVMLGIDLSRLRVKPDGNLLLVDGLHAQFQGVRDSQEEWLFRQVQMHEDNLLLSNKIRVDDDTPLLMTSSDKHRQDLDERWKNGVELKAFDAALERLGEQWLRALFAPLGYTIRVTPLALGESQLFVDYLKEHQQRLDAEQARLESHPVLPINPSQTPTP